MANDNPRMSHNSQKNQRTIEQGEDGFADDQSAGQPTVGTHTPGNHQRSETVREGGSEQTHENRANPEKDHVPGHLGYSINDVKGVNPTDTDNRH